MKIENSIIFPHPPGKGGPGSFQTRFEKTLANLGWKLAYARTSETSSIIFIVGGTRKLIWLLKMKMKGIPIVFRLDGINWLHKKKKFHLKNYTYAEIRNFLNKIIHAFIADYVVYQSEFVKEWWNRKGFIKVKSYSVIYNGVDLTEFSPTPSITGCISLLCLEGAIDYSPYAIEVLNKLRTTLPEDIPMILYGGFENEISKGKLHPAIEFKGFVDKKNLPTVYQKAIYLSLDVHPACPNTVIESLACGAPIVAFDTGSLKELVPPDSGIIVPYGSDPWELGLPDIEALAKAILDIRNNWEDYSKKARQTAVERYDINTIVSKYINVVGSQITKKSLNQS